MYMEHYTPLMILDGSEGLNNCSDNIVNMMSVELQGSSRTLPCNSTSGPMLTRLRGKVSLGMELWMAE